MPVEVIGIDHVYFAVRDLARSATFYDTVMGVLGYQRVEGPIGGDPHVHYFNRQFGFSLRPARAGTPGSRSVRAGSAPLLLSRDRRAHGRSGRGRASRGGRSKCRKAALYPEYAPDYYAMFFEDPDGLRLEITNFRAGRRQRMYLWHEVVKPPPR